MLAKCKLFKLRGLYSELLPFGVSRDQNSTPKADPDSYPSRGTKGSERPESFLFLAPVGLEAVEHRCILVQDRFFVGVGEPILLPDFRDFMSAELLIDLMGEVGGEEEGLIANYIDSIS